MVLNAQAIRLDRDVAEWNARVRVGDPVTVRLDSGRVVESVTTGPAWVLSGHSAVVFVEAVKGFYLLSRVKPNPSRTARR